VHRGAKKRMRVADHRGKRRRRGGGGRPENRFQASGRSFQREIAYVVSAAHQLAMGEFAVYRIEEKRPNSFIPRGER
jgi:hypothetical protein